MRAGTVSVSGILRTPGQRAFADTLPVRVWDTPQRRLEAEFQSGFQLTLMHGLHTGFAFKFG